MLVQDAPYVIVTDVAQGFRQQRSVPLGIAFRRSLIKQPQHTPFGFLRIGVRFAGPGSVGQAVQATSGNRTIT